jgi:hypothetical protein
MILDTPRQADEHTLTRFFSDTDRDLSAFALRYGTDHHHLLVFDGDHNPYWQGRRPTVDDIENRILSGELFALAVPDEERRSSWGLYENQTGHDVTLQTAVTEINGRPFAVPQPVVTADLLWSYAVNANMRATCLHGRPEGERYSFNLDPSRATLAAGQTVMFPLVQDTTSRPVCAAPGCTVPLSPRPAWIPAYHHQISEIERLAHRVDLVRRHIERLHLEGAQKVALLDFELELLDRLRLELNDSSSSLRGVRDAIHTLRQRAQQHMVEASAETVRPMWFRELERASAELRDALSDSSFLERQDFMWADGPHFDRNAVDRGVDLVLSEAVEALGLSGTTAAQDFFNPALILVDGRTPPSENVATLFLRKFYSTVVAAGPIVISNTPGPATLASVVFAYQIFYSLADRMLPAAQAAQRRTSFMRFLTRPMNAADAAAFETALNAPLSELHGPAPAQGTPEAEAWAREVVQQGRANRMMSVMRRALGTGANVFALACSLLALFSTVSTGAGDSRWSELGFALNLAGNVTSTASAVISLSNGAQNVARRAMARWMPAAAAEDATLAASRLNNLMGRVTGIIAIVQGTYQVADFALTDEGDRRLSNFIAGTLTLVGGELTIAATCEAIPGLQIAGVIIALGAVIAASWPHDGDNFKALIAGLVEAFKTEAVEGSPGDAQYYDSFMGGGFGSWSFYGLVVGEDTAQHPSTHALAQAAHAVTTALGSWPGQALRDNADNRAYLRRHHFSEEQIEAIVD